MDEADLLKRATRKDFLAECKRIMASDESEERRIRLVELAAEIYLDDNFHRFPESRTIDEKQRAIEMEHTGTPERPTYCPKCGAWAPAPPLKWVNLCRAWTRAKHKAIGKMATPFRKRRAA